MSITDALAQSVAAELNALGIEASPADVHLERPARTEHGDFSSNVALAMAKRAGRKPRELADALAVALTAAPPEHVATVEVAGPGFVNFKLHPSWLHEVLVEVVTATESGYAAPDLGHGERTQIEFVSANPTGPVHVGNGWFGSYGDALARILERTGSVVSREFYVNDTGGQIRLRRRRAIKASTSPRSPPSTRAPTRSWRQGALPPSASLRTSAPRWTASTSSLTSGTRKPPSRRAARSPK
jgi:arginyl-tRNA synthetase